MPQPSLVMVTLPYLAVRIPGLGLNLGPMYLPCSWEEGRTSGLHLGFWSMHVTGLSEFICCVNEWAEWIWEGGESREPVLHCSVDPYYP